MKRFSLVLVIVLFIFSCTPVEIQKDKLFLYEDSESHELGISYGNNLLTILNYSQDNYKPYFFPVITLSGTRITRGWPIDPEAFEPVDHPHQKGMWFNFGNVNGIDFWNNSDFIKPDLKQHYGKIINDSLVVVELTDSQAKFILYNKWISEAGKNLLSEKAIFYINIENDYWSLDRVTFLMALTDIEFMDNKEGLLAIRMAREFQSDFNNAQYILNNDLQYSHEKIVNNEGKTGYYLGSNGREGAEVWGTANAWVNLSGIKNNDSISVLLMDHHTNFSHPPHWHARDYGLFSVDNFGRNAFNSNLETLVLNLKEDEELRFIHRIVFQNGGHISRTEAEKMYESFSLFED